MAYDKGVQGSRITLQSRNKMYYQKIKMRDNGKDHIQSKCNRTTKNQPASLHQKHVGGSSLVDKIDNLQRQSIRQ